MTNESILRLLDAMSDEIPVFFEREGYRADTCILQTRVALHVLASLGVPAMAQAMKLVAMNAKYAELLVHTKGEPLPEEQRAAAKASGAWAVTVGYGAEPGQRPGYDGHVVVIVKRRWLLDLTSGQAARPAKGIHVPRALFFEMGRERVAGRHPVIGPLRDAGQLVYTWHRNAAYLRAPDWTMVRPDHELVRKTLTLVAPRRAAA